MVKNALFALLLLLSTAPVANAQNQAGSSGQSPRRTFIIWMRDTNIIYQSVFNPTRLRSPDAAIQQILDNYTVYRFKKAFPASRFSYMKEFYSITTTSLNLLYELKNAKPDIFPSGREEPSVIPTYQPNEFFNGTGSEKYLGYINADGAWDYTHGDPDVVIGVADTYFDFSNPDLIGRIAKKRDTVCHLPQYIDHGTTVAGFAACNTDDGGMAGVGWNCRLDVSTDMNASQMLQFSKGNANTPGRKILNGSWLFRNHDCGTYGPFSYYGNFSEDQLVYDEIYENGSIAFFGAGNGGANTPDCGTETGDNPYIFEEEDLKAYAFPASFDHCMSISGVGYDESRPLSINSAGMFERLNWAGVHRQNADNPASAMHHNDRVDLLAPSYKLPCLTYNPNNPDMHTGINGGTSFATPMCAGTAALMQAVSHNQCLSPYQVEYILKSTAYFVDTIPENAPYAGMLGAGVLDAGAAVRAARYTADTNPCNNPATQTFIIKGVEVNTICAPGHSSNGIEPKLTPILENGTPPYTYKWEPLFHNNNLNLTLDAYDIAEPTILTVPIDGSTNKPIVFMRLTVTDNSVVPKVANRFVLMYLKTSGHDLAMRDSYMDMLREPNDIHSRDPREAIWWDSPDIWNRRTDDGGLIHQSPEYYVSDSNYIYTRVRNVGCAASGYFANVRLYWTLQSTGEDWDNDWKGANFPGNPNLPAGRQITDAALYLPVLQPGESVILKKGWRSQNPADYNANISTLDVCVLARLEETYQPPYGMHSLEVFNQGIGANVKNNNNIVTRNFTVVDLLPGNLVPERLLVIANPEQNAQLYTFQLINDREIFRHMSGDFSSVGFVRIHLGQKLFERWMAAGGHGNYAAADPRNYTIDFDGSTTLELQHIELAAGEHIPVTLSFMMREGAVPTGMDYTIHARQIAEPEGEEMWAEGEEEITGGVTYRVHTSPKLKPINGKTILPEQPNEHYMVYPNPATDKVYVSSKGSPAAVSVTLTDMAGRVLLTRNFTLGTQEIGLSNVKAGIYILSITDSNNKTERFKIVKQ